MKRIAMVIAALLIASSAEACWRCGRANCCGIPTCIFAPVIETVAVETAPPIVWHQDGTYWQGSFEVIEGKVLDRSSPTGWRVYWYQKPFASYAGAQSNLYNYRPLAQPGTTLFGYSLTDTVNYVPGYRAAAEAYREDDAQVFNQASRLTEHAQELSSQAFGRFLDSVDARKQLNAQNEQLYLKGQIAMQIMSILNPTPANEQRTITIQAKQDASGKWTIQQPDDNAVATTESFLKVLEANCLSCHASSGSNAEALKALDLTRILTANYETVKLIRGRVSATDATKRMPKGKPPLTPDQLAAVIDYETFIRNGGRPKVSQSEKPTPPQVPPQRSPY